MTFFSDWPATTLCFRSLNNPLSEFDRPDPLITKKNYNTEHFLSQKPDYHVTEEDMEVVDNVGNLFIISRHTNSHLQNKPPVQKIDLLKDRGRQLVYVTKFVEEFESGDQAWGKNEITKRARDLAEKAYKNVWKIEPM